MNYTTFGNSPGRGGDINFISHLQAFFPDYGERHQLHQPISFRESSYAALPLALLACSIAVLHTTISITLHRHQLLRSFCSLLLLFCSATACLLPLLFSCLPFDIG